MNKAKHITIGLTSGSLAALAVIAMLSMAEAQAPTAETISQRQEAMKGLGGAMRTLTPMVRAEAAWDQAAAAKAAEALAGTGKVIPQVFPQGSGPEAGKTSALPVIWQQWGDFQEKSKALAEEGGKLLELAKANDQNGFKAQFAIVGKTCGGCHETYRQKQN